jgi:hypothetical protein
MSENGTLTASMIKGLSVFLSDVSSISEFMLTFNTEGLSLPDDQEYQYPVNYAYDYLYGRVEYLVNPRLKLNDRLESEMSLRVEQADDVDNLFSNEHAIDLFPARAGLPWPSGILSCRQNKYWQLSIDTSRVFLALFAADETCQKIFKSGHSIAEIARKELCTKVEEGWSKFPAYLFPESDMQRTRLLAITNVFVFVFDGRMVLKEIHELRPLVQYI